MDAFICEKCGEPSDDVGCDENNWCVACYEEWFAYQVDYYRPIYEGEKQAGLHWKEDE